MADTRDQTLTQVQSPLSPGEQRDRAVLLVSGNAVTPGLAARVRLQIVGDELYIGRRADGLPVQASVAVLDDGLISGQHARIVRGSAISSWMIACLQYGTIRPESPPVATTVVFFPSSSSILSIMPSTMDAVPKIAPLFMQSIVLALTTFSGGSIGTFGSCDVPRDRAFMESATPGYSAPPR
jgi:hypothetical protein